MKPPQIDLPPPGPDQVPVSQSVAALHTAQDGLKFGLIAVGIVLAAFAGLVAVGLLLENNLNAPPDPGEMREKGEQHALAALMAPGFRTDWGAAFEVRWTARCVGEARPPKAPT